MPFPRFSHLRNLFRFRTLIPAFNRTRLFSHQHKSRLDDAGPLACRLGSRSVIRFRGPDTNKFLQGLLTNDVRPLVDIGHSDDRTSSVTAGSYLPALNLPFHSPSPIYAALLSPQGRFLYDLFLYRLISPQEKALTFYADVDASILEEILVCFRKWALCFSF